MLRSNNNDTQVQRGQLWHDPVHKMRPILGYLNLTFEEVYTPEETLTID
jgi:hypothetical protein